MGALGNLVWLFREHRDLHAAYTATRTQMLLLEQTIADLEAQLRRQAPPSVDNLLENHRQNVLREEPFPDGKVPDGFWLTPGDNDRSER